MPAIDQCDSSQATLALSSTLEIFDKFKSVSECGKDSDSEESFHLPLDDEDGETQSIISNGRDKELQSEETEDDILNKFEGDCVDASEQNDETILNDIEEEHHDKSVSIIDKQNIEENELSATEVKLSFDFGKYETNSNGEFRSIYETEFHVDKEEENNEESKTMEICDSQEEVGDAMETNCSDGKETENDIEKIDNHLDSVNETNVSNSLHVTDTDNLSQTDNHLDSVDETNASNSLHVTDTDNLGETEQPISVETESASNKQDTEVSEVSKVSTSDNERTSTDDLLKQLEETINSPKEDDVIEDKLNSNEVFKVPEQQNNLHVESDSTKMEECEKPSEKPEEDDSDLLDISMIRETEEDDACARADAIQEDADAEEAKEDSVIEKSDEESNDRVETEQISSDGDKEHDNDFDNEHSGFEEINDEDSHSGLSLSVDTDDADSQTDSNTELQNTVVETESHEKSSAVASEDTIDDQMEIEAVVSEPEETNIVDDGSSNKEVPNNADLTLIETDTHNDITEKEISTTTNEIVKSDEISEKGLEGSKAVNTSQVQTKSGKRSLSANDTDQDELIAKKPKLADSITDVESTNEVTDIPVNNNKPESEKTEEFTTLRNNTKTLTAFSKFMQCRKLTAKLSRSDLEQFCIQKICESLMLKSTEGELHQTIKKQEKTIEILRKDLQQLVKQSRDLDIVNKKLMNDLRAQTVQKKPLVPLKITRSVGLQVRLNPGNEAVTQVRKRQSVPNTPPKQVVLSNSLLKQKASPQQKPVVRQIVQTSPQKSISTTQSVASPVTGGQLLTQALLQPSKRSPVVAKRTTTPVRKPPEPPKPSNPGVIDLTDEDEKLAANKAVNNTIKLVTTKPVVTTTPKPIVTVNKSLSGKTVISQGKQVGVQAKSVTVSANKNTSIPQSIRLTPGSVITSSANGSPQMLYVVPTISSSTGGTQKVAFVNFQPTSGVLSAALNGQTVSVMSNKQGQTMTLKTVPSVRKKHPAPLPPVPRINIDSNLKPLLPKPHLTIKKIDIGIILQWKMPYNLSLYENIASYQLYAYQETSAPPNTDMWRKVGDVKALALPMACTLTQFADKNKYYFAVRSVDVHNRIGAFSDPEEISL